MKWSGICIHHTESPDHPERVDTPEITRWHRERGWLDVGYHFLVEMVDRAPYIIAGRPLSLQGAHCAGHNDKLIGVALVGNFNKAIPGTALLNAAARLCNGLLATIGRSESSIFFHDELAKTDCPGRLFPNRPQSGRGPLAATRTPGRRPRPGLTPVSLRWSWRSTTGPGSPCLRPGCARSAIS